MAKCDDFKARIASYETDVVNTASAFETAKANAVYWIGEFQRAQGQYRCGSGVKRSDVSGYYVSGAFNSGECRTPTVGFSCSKDSCVAIINNSVNPALAAMQSAYATMNNAISKLANEKSAYAADPECAATQILSTPAGAAAAAIAAEQAAKNSEASRKVRNNIIISAAIVIIIIGGIWAYRKYIRK